MKRNTNKKAATSEDYGTVRYYINTYCHVAPLPSVSDLAPYQIRELAILLINTAETCKIDGDIVRLKIEDVRNGYGTVRKPEVKTIPSSSGKGFLALLLEIGQNS